MYMADVPAYVTGITAGAALVGAIASPLVIAYREGHQAKRERKERETSDRRQAYLELLATAVQLRTQVASYYEHKGPGLRDRLEQVRKLAADTELNAVRVRLLAPGAFSKLAGNLATAATSLAEQTIRDTDQSLEAVTSGTKPNYEQLDECARSFRRAVTEAGMNG
jgi:hypothetical protein